MGGGSQSMSLYMEKLEKLEKYWEPEGSDMHRGTESQMHEMHGPVKTQDSWTELSMENGDGL